MDFISVYWVIPFVLILIAIATLPLMAPHFWEANRNKALVSLGLALPTAGYLVINDPHALYHTAQEYFSFISLLSSLYIISGGIFLGGDLKATPLVNTTFLATGSVLASLIGTTGASMLLIRPLLKTNQERQRVSHIPIFFIFTVSNIGGLLTPIGDPPLFLGFLRGVPFFWTMKLFPLWLFCIGVLLVVFFVLDSRAYRHETKRDLRADSRHVRPLHVSGKGNLALLAGVIVGVFLPAPYREVEMWLMAAVSLWRTSARVRTQNQFNYHPILEVAVLFAGIFVAMVPALDLLKMHGATFGISEPFEFFWCTGFLSSFLDNAPTYLTFFSLAQGLPMAQGGVVGIEEPILYAISAGAVMMGANTYIGNGPNFMVKAISDEMGVKTPTFVGYMFYSLIILIPLFLVVTGIFMV